MHPYPVVHNGCVSFLFHPSACPVFNVRNSINLLSNCLNALVSQQMAHSSTPESQGLLRMWTWDNRSFELSIEGWSDLHYFLLTKSFPPFFTFYIREVFLFVSFFPITFKTFFSLIISNVNYYFFVHTLTCSDVQLKTLRLLLSEMHLL